MSSQANYKPPKFKKGQPFSAHGHGNQLIDATYFAASSVFNWQPAFYSKHWGANTSHPPEPARISGGYALTHMYAYRHKLLLDDDPTYQAGRFVIQYECNASAQDQLRFQVHFKRYAGNNEELTLTETVTSPKSLPNPGEFSPDLSSLNLELNDFVIVTIKCSRYDGSLKTDPGPVWFAPVFVGEVDQVNRPVWPTLANFHHNTEPSEQDWQELSRTAELAINRSTTINPGFVGYRIGVDTRSSKNRIYILNRNERLFCDWTLADTLQDDRYAAHIWHDGNLIAARGNGSLSGWDDPFEDPTTATTIKALPITPPLSGNNNVEGVWSNGDIVTLGKPNEGVPAEVAMLGTWDPNAEVQGQGNGAFVNCVRNLNGVGGVNLDGAGQAILAHINYVSKTPGSIFGALRIVDQEETQRLLFDTDISNLGIGMNEIYLLEVYTTGYKSGQSLDGDFYFHGMYEQPDESPTRIAWENMPEFEYLDWVADDSNSYMEPIRDNLNELKNAVLYRNPAALFYDTAIDTGTEWNAEETPLPRSFIRTGRWLHYFVSGTHVRWSFDGLPLDDDEQMNPEIRYNVGIEWRSVGLESSEGWHIYDLDEAEGLYVGNEFFLTHAQFGLIDIDP